MAIGDVVKVGMGTVQTASDSVPVYNLASDNNNNIVFDHQGSATPRVVGGVKGGSIGRIVGAPVKVLKGMLAAAFHQGAASMAIDHVLLFPVEFEHYKQTAWVMQDHVHIIG